MPLATDGAGDNLLQRLDQYARDYNLARGLSSKIECAFIDDLITASDDGLISLKDFYLEYGLNGGTMAGYMTAARFFTRAERMATDPQANFPMTLWKTAYECTSKDDGDGYLPRAKTLAIIREYVVALDNGGAVYEDDHTSPIEPTVKNLKTRIRHELELHDGNPEPAVSREFMPIIAVVGENARQAAFLLGYAKLPQELDTHDLFAQVTWIYRKASGE
jgi:hypothetical protein